MPIHYSLITGEQAASGQIVWRWVTPTGDKARNVNLLAILEQAGKENWETSVTADIGGGARVEIILKQVT
jgi:hypothetical protein